MCRHLAYVGAPEPLGILLFDAPHSLEHQTFAPRHQDVGRINADGWGVGWWDLAIRREPARYRTATPMWADRRFREIVPLVRAGSMMAAARNASPGAPVEESGNAPFTAGPWLFSHNGFVEGFRDGLGETLRREVSDRRALGILGSADSEVVFALLLDRLDAGEPPPDAVAGLVTDLAQRAGGRLNVLLGDGHQLIATSWGNSLFIHRGAQGVVVASEPTDDRAEWVAIPDRSLVTVTTDSDQRDPHSAATVRVEPLA